jgi:putative tricarboxylic transport membrane protein
VKKTRITRDGWCGIFCFTFGALLCYAASRLGVGSATDPGSGFIFFWSGLIMALLSLALFVESVRELSGEIRYVARTNWAKIVLVLSSLVLYALFFERLGFVLSTFLLMSFLLTATDAKGWPRIIGVAGAVALVSFAMFELWLKIRMPKGIFDF